MSLTTKLLTIELCYKIIISITYYSGFDTGQGMLYNIYTFFSNYKLMLFSLVPQMITLPYQSSTPVSLLGIQSVIKSHENRAGTIDQVYIVPLCYAS